MRASRAAVLGLLASLPGCVRGQPATSSAAAPAHTDTAALRRTLDSLADAHHGVVGYAVRNLETGEQLARRGDETFPTASLIKVPILVTLYDLVEKKQISLDDQITLSPIDQVPGAGVLQFFHPGTQVTVHDAAWLMTTLSDNTATNLLLDKISIRRVWEKMESLGLRHTKVHAKVFLAKVTSLAPDSSAKYGLGVTTPNEMATLFGLLATGRAVSAAADSAMITILEHNTDEQLLQRYAGGVRAAHKTGAVDEVRTECSLFWLRGRVVACVLSRENVDKRWVLDSEAQLTLARMGEAIVKAWRPPERAAASR
ncbi:MAG: serine hydrolase [Gemmatimonadaceae bacterium]